MSKLIYVENDYDRAYGRFWSNLGEIVLDRNRFLSEPEAFDLVCFTGGEDVSPELYGHRDLGSHTSSPRDKREVLVYQMARENQIPCTGICRGSQFLNAMCGQGTMVQHLKKSHGGGRHRCLTADGSAFEVTSSHHQMSVLGPGGILLGWAEEEVPVESLVYDGDPRPALQRAGNLLEEDMCLVTEAFAYPEQRVFAVQHHPEWQNMDEEAPQWTLRMIRKYCWNQESESIEGTL